MYCDRVMSKKIDPPSEEMISCVMIADEDSLMELPKSTNTVFYDMTEVFSSSISKININSITIISFRFHQ